MLKLLVNNYPVQVFKKRQLIVNEKQLFELVKSYNGKKTLYYSLYSIRSEMVVDKIFFDFDGPNSLQGARRLVKYCLQHNFQFCVLFSGSKGFHVYVFCKPTTNTELLKNAHVFLDETLGLESDKAIHGDVFRLARLPNTLHLGSRKYCIPLTVADLRKSFEEIKNKASNPSKEFVVYGNVLFDIETIPIITRQSNNNIPLFDYSKIKDVKDGLLEKFPPCAVQWLTSYEQATHRNRFYFAQVCAHLGLSKTETNSLARKYYGRMKERGGNRSRYKEFVSEKALDYAFEKDFIIPKCSRLFEQGSCLGKCKLYNPTHYPIYKEVID